MNFSVHSVDWQIIVKYNSLDRIFKITTKYIQGVHMSNYDSKINHIKGLAKLANFAEQDAFNLLSEIPSEYHSLMASGGLDSTSDIRDKLSEIDKDILSLMLLHMLKNNSYEAYKAKGEKEGKSVFDLCLKDI